MKRRWMGLTLAFLLLAAIFPGRAGADTAAAETGGVRGRGAGAGRSGPAAGPVSDTL